MSQPQTSRGFSLIDILIALAISGALAAITVPLYKNHLTKARRHNGQAALMLLGQHLQRIYTRSGSYTPGGATPDLPTTNDLVKRSSEHYSFSLETINGQAYVLRATPKGSQSDDGYLEFTNANQRRWDADNSGSISDNEKTW